MHKLNRLPHHVDHATSTSCSCLRRPHLLLVATLFLCSCGPRRLVHRWYGGSGLTPYAEVLAPYLDEVQRRAARDGKAFNAEKAVRFK